MKDIASEVFTAAEVNKISPGCVNLSEITYVSGTISDSIIRPG
jgi:hypothetical protein